MNLDNIIIPPAIIPIPAERYIAKLKLFKEVKFSQREYRPKADNIETPSIPGIIAALIPIKPNIKP